MCSRASRMGDAKNYGFQKTIEPPAVFIPLAAQLDVDDMSERAIWHVHRLMQDLQQAGAASQILREFSSGFNFQSLPTGRISAVPSRKKLAVCSRRN